MFHDAVALLAHLEATHEPGVHVYRGQTERRTHDWIDDDGPVRLESLYPSDYRFITNYDGPVGIAPHDVKAAREYGRTIRDYFATATMMRAVSGDPAFEWLQEHVGAYIDHVTTVFKASGGGQRLFDLARETDQDLSAVSTPLFRILWSLAQHYLISTALTDVTFSPRIAAWFATHPWKASDPVPSKGSGVIYRFRRSELEAVLERQTRAMRDWAHEQGLVPPPALFCVDIRRIPASFARRPSGQEGGSVYGFDQPKVLRDVLKPGCMEIFEFRHGPAAAPLGSLRETIVPADDPFAVRCDDVRAGLSRLGPKLVPPAASTGAKPVAAGPAQYLQQISTMATLAITGARFEQRIPLVPDYAGYHFVDIETLPGASHGYAQLLVIVNEKTRGVLGYVSAEPLAAAAPALPVELFQLAQWFGGSRAPADFGTDLGEAVAFLARAVPIATQAVAPAASEITRSDIDALVRRLGGIEQAAATLQNASRAGSLEAAVDLGSLLAAQSRISEAETIWREAMACGSADAANNLARMYVELGRLGQAEITYRKALELGDREAAYGLGCVFELQRDWVQAEHFYRRAVEEQADPRAPNNLAMIMLKQGRRNEAERYLRLGVAMGDELAGQNLKRLLQGGGRGGEG